MYRTTILLFIALFTGSCSDPLVPERDLSAPMQTDALEYELQPWKMAPERGVEITIGFTFYNKSGRAIYLVQCSRPGFILERRTSADTWQVVWSGPDYERCLGPPTTIEAGDSIRGSVTVEGAHPPGQGLLPEWDVDTVEGIYRLRFATPVFLEHVDDYPDGQPVPTAEVRSNLFRLMVR